MSTLPCFITATGTERSIRLPTSCNNIKLYLHDSETSPLTQGASRWGRGECSLGCGCQSKQHYSARLSTTESSCPRATHESHTKSSWHDGDCTGHRDPATPRTPLPGASTRDPRPGPPRMPAADRDLRGGMPASSSLTMPLSPAGTTRATTGTWDRLGPPGPAPAVCAPPLALALAGP